MSYHINRYSNASLSIGAFLLTLFLLLPIGAILGLGLYYILGIFVVADVKQLTAALNKEVLIVPALRHAPLIAIAVMTLSTIWGFALSLIWRRWIEKRYYVVLILSSLPFLLPRFGIGALFLLACLKLVQWGGNGLGIGLVILSQASVAAPLVAVIICFGWRRIDPAWHNAALEAGARDITIFRRLTLPILKPFIIFGSMIAFSLSLGDFYLSSNLSGDYILLPSAILSGVAQNASPLYHALVAVMILINLIIFIAVTWSLKIFSPR